MSIRYHNSLSKREEPFSPIEPGVVRFYSCGPTVHDFAHIGNFRCFVFVDVLRRHLELRGYQVHHIMNITDVGHLTTDADEGEDKIGKSAKEKGLTPWEVVQRFSDAFFEDSRTLRLLPAEKYPRATEHVPDMIRLVERILANGFAYVSNGSVYFDVARFEPYGRLSGNTMANLREGARVEVNPEKRSPVDFALWKAAPTSFMRWESPWSVGVPGWHIECTAMAMRYLAEQIDIHTGGEDNLFPHHECEIAQAEAATGKAPYVRFWMHNRHLLVNGTKMSKSLGNFFTLRDLLDRLERKGHPRTLAASAIRCALLPSHYRSPLNFVLDNLDAAVKWVIRINDFVRQLKDTKTAGPGPNVADLCQKAMKRFADALDDDLNTSSALGEVFELMHNANSLEHTASSARTVLEAMAYFDRVLAIIDDNWQGKRTLTETEAEAMTSGRTSFQGQFQINVQDQATAPSASGEARLVPFEDWVDQKIAERVAARKARDFAKADAIRDELKACGILIEDTPKGVQWRRVKPGS